jgi:hypothetical protein
MKKLLIALGLTFNLLCLPAYAEWLTCDPVNGADAFDVEVDGVVVESLFPAEADGTILWNVDHLSYGPHTFRLKAYNASGWGSAWSAPLDATKPENTGGVRITQ